MIEHTTKIRHTLRVILNDRLEEVWAESLALQMRDEIDKDILADLRK